MAISQEKDNIIIARFFPNEDMIEKLKEVCQKHRVKTGIFVSGIGQLAEFELGFFKEKSNYLNQKFFKPAELLSLAGIVSQQGGAYEFHLHAALSAADKTVVGGHFISGKVSITAEIVLMKTDLSVKRETEEATGLRGLFLE